jgi:phosphomannomutase
MSIINWKALQQGSDIRGVAVAGTKNEEVTLTPSIAARLSESFLAWLAKKTESKNGIMVSIGMDSRISSPELKQSVVERLIECGANVSDFGLASSPAMFLSTLTENPATAAIMITASHLSANKNGLKFYTKNGGLNKDEITELLTIAESNDNYISDKKGTVQQQDFMADYIGNLVATIRKQVNCADDFNRPLKGLKIVVDAGNGVGGFYATKVLEPLGADISESQFLEPNGRFPGHIPNPEDDMAMMSVSNRVKEAKADLGIIFDSDLDRVGLVSHDGTPINKNSLIALAAAVVLKEHPKTTIVTDSITSNGLSWFINKQLKGHHHKYQRGYNNVINEAINLNSKGKECWLAIETSGHAAFKENHFMDDGAFLATKLIITMAKMNKKDEKLVSLIEKMPLPTQSHEIRIPINAPNFKEYGQQVIMDLGILAASKQGWDIDPDNFEGVRINCDLPNHNGWFLLRLSIHNSAIPLNIESEVKGGIKEIATILYNFLIQYEKLDLKGFQQIL